LGWLARVCALCTVLQANMIYRRNLYVNVTTTGAGACGSCQGPDGTQSKCLAGCPSCSKHQPGCNHTAMTECRHACKAICDVACGKAKPVPGQPMPPVPGGTLDTTINSNTFASLTKSSRLSGEKTVFFVPLLLRTEYFAKTGSG
jgi:hypothetical protein